MMCTPVIPALSREMPEDYKVEASLGCLACCSTLSQTTKGNIVECFMITIFDLYSDVVGNPFNSLLTLLIASVKCKQEFNRLLSCKVFFKVALCLFNSIHLEFVFVILEFSV